MGRPFCSSSVAGLIPGVCPFDCVASVCDRPGRPTFHRSKSLPERQERDEQNDLVDRQHKSARDNAGDSARQSNQSPMTARDAAAVCEQVGGLFNFLGSLDELVSSPADALSFWTKYTDQVFLADERWQEVEASGLLQGYRWEHPSSTRATATATLLSYCMGVIKNAIVWVEKKTGKTLNHGWSEVPDDFVGSRAGRAFVAWTISHADKKRAVMDVRRAVDKERLYFLESTVGKTEDVSASKVPSVVIGAAPLPHDPFIEEAIRFLLQHPRSWTEYPADTSDLDELATEMLIRVGLLQGRVQVEVSDHSGVVYRGRVKVVGAWESDTITAETKRRLPGNLPSETSISLTPYTHTRLSAPGELAVRGAESEEGRKSLTQHIERNREKGTFPKITFEESDYISPNSPQTQATAVAGASVTNVNHAPVNVTVQVPPPASPSDEREKQEPVDDTTDQPEQQAAEQTPPPSQSDRQPSQADRDAYLAFGAGMDYLAQKYGKTSPSQREVFEVLETALDNAIDREEVGISEDWRLPSTLEAFRKAYKRYETWLKNQSDHEHHRTKRTENG